MANVEPRHAQKIHVVTYTVDGEKVEERLPKEEAQKLFRKIRNLDKNAWIEEE